MPKKKPPSLSPLAAKPPRILRVAPAEAALGLACRAHRQQRTEPAARLSSASASRRRPRSSCAARPPKLASAIARRARWAGPHNTSGSPTCVHDERAECVTSCKLTGVTIRKVLPPIETYADVQRLVSSGVQEELRLEYKSGRPTNRDRFKNDIAQDISAFANSAGGTLIIGVLEKDGMPVSIDGVDQHFSRESLGQVLAYKISPAIPGLRIESLSSDAGEAVLVVSVQASRDAPTRALITFITADTSTTTSLWRTMRSRTFGDGKYLLNPLSSFQQPREER